jgi:hypothetical protein
MYVIILITLAPVLGKRLITLPSSMITMIILPPCSPAASATCPAAQHRQKTVKSGKGGKSGTIPH